MLLANHRKLNGRLGGALLVLRVLSGMALAAGLTAVVFHVPWQARYEMLVPGGPAVFYPAPETAPLWRKPSPPQGPMLGFRSLGVSVDGHLLLDRMFLAWGGSALVLGGFGFALVGLVRRRHRLRRGQDRCLTCGYSLQGLYDNACPECGDAKQYRPAPVMPRDILIALAVAVGAVLGLLIPTVWVRVYQEMVPPPLWQIGFISAVVIFAAIEARRVGGAN